MAKARTAYRTDAAAKTAAAAPATNGVHGAEAFNRALAAAGSRSTPPVGQVVSPRQRKSNKRAERFVRQADRAVTERRYGEAARLYDEAIELLEAPSLRLVIRRLAMAAKAFDYDYVAENYKRVRAMAHTDDDRALVDHAWIDCLFAVGCFREALQIIEFWSQRKTASWSSMRSVGGVIHARLGDFATAIAMQKSVLEVYPDHALARWHLALHQITAGVLPEGFETYEARWNWPDFPSERRTFDIPRLPGPDVRGKRVLVWREQGIGDEIRFAGVLPDLVAAGADVTFECSPKLVPLFEASFGEVDVRAQRPAAQRKAAHYRSFDYEVPVGSLARVFRSTAESMRARCRPWLKRDPAIEDKLRQAMNAAPQQPVIGLCWRSSNRNLHRDQHYLKPEDLAAFRLLGRSGFVCLQYDECAEEVALMQELGLPITVFTGLDQTNDLAAASRLAGACDLVISAGTATAELAAGLGVPTLLFGQTHSQIKLGTDGVPWHPATRYLNLDPDDPMATARAILLDWPAIAAWAQEKSISGRTIDWRLSFPETA